MNSLETHRLKLHLEKTDLNALLTEIKEGFAPRIKHTGGRLQLNLKADPSLILTDRTFIKNTLFNLLDNALKYTDKSPEINISTANLKNSILLTIADNGTGIPKKYQKKIFNRFFRVPTGNIHNVKGFGLGLTYVKKIIKAHKWKIKLNSKTGEGTSVLIIIPRK